jgi:hypothetical protein
MKIIKHVEDEGGDGACPLTAPELIAMMTDYLFRRYRIGRSTKRRGELPVNVQVFKIFLMKIVLFGCDAGIVPTLSISYDDYRRPKTGRPRGGSATKKNSLPAVPLRYPEAGVPRMEDDFHGSGVNRIDSCLFLQSLFPSGFISLPC